MSVAAGEVRSCLLPAVSGVKPQISAAHNCDGGALHSLEIPEEAMLIGPQAAAIRVPSPGCIHGNGRHSENPRITWGGAQQARAGDGGEHRYRQSFTFMTCTCLAVCVCCFLSIPCDCPLRLYKPGVGLTGRLWPSSEKQN